MLNVPPPPAPASHTPESDTLYQVFEQTPAAICLLRGPEHRLLYYNQAYQALFPGREMHGSTIAEIQPEAVDQGFVALLDHVYHTGETYFGREMRLAIDQLDGQPLKENFFNFTYQAYRENSQILGISVFAYDVTEQVRSRQETERQRRLLYQLYQEVPAAICIFGGPDHVYELVNPSYQKLFPGRELLGKPLLEALPDMAYLDAYRTLRHVYETGQPHRELGISVPLPQYAGGPVETRYLNYVQQPRRNDQGQVDGVMVFTFDVTEQVRAYEDAERQRQLLHSLYAHAPVPIAVLDGPNWVYQLVNSAYQGIFPGRDLLGRPVLEALPEIADSPLPAILERVYRTGESFSAREMPLYMARYEGAKPEEIYGTFTCQPRRNAQGEVDGLVFFALDVTEQVHTRQQAEQSEARFRRLAETTPMIVWEADAQGLTTYLSPHWEQFTTAANGQGLGWKEFVHPDDQAPFWHSWLDSVNTGQPFQAEMRLRVAATGEYRWHLDRAVPVRDNQGQITQWVGAAIDIHELKHLQQVLLESEQYFRQMADHVPAMLWVTDAQGQCTYLNQQWYAYTGQTEADALGMGWLQAVYSADAPSVGTDFGRANTHQVPYRSVYRLRRHDGEHRWVIDAALPRFSSTGDYVGLVGVVFDIHERQLAEHALQRLTQKLRSTNEQLTRTNVDLDNFIYTASHDLKQPIANLEGLLEALRTLLDANYVLPADVPTIVRMMHDSVERFKRTIDYLTDITKLQKEHGQPATEVPVQPVIHDVLLDLQPLIEQQGAQVEIDLDGCHTVSFTAKNLRSVVYNLLSNALKYRHPDRPPHVLLRCRREGAYAVLSVQDNGLGLEPARQSELFGMFRRFHSHVEGSGIGLYMVKRAIENAGGRIEVRSELGQGSVFYVYLRQ